MQACADRRKLRYFAGPFELLNSDAPSWAYSARVELDAPYPAEATPFRERLDKDIDTARQIDLEAQECGAMIVRAG
jgi:hypothetical protein